MALDLKNLTIRSVSGLVYAGLLIGAIILGPLASAILLGLFAALAAYELENNTLRKENPAVWSSMWMLDAIILIVLIFSFGFSDFTYFGIPIYGGLLFLRFFLQIFMKQRNPLKPIAIMAFEQLYLGVPLCMFVALTGIFCFSPWILVCALAMIWINDTGAYIVGSLFGRHKMFPSLSPKKSWEGFLGGLAFNIGFAFIVFYCFNLRSFTLFSNVEGWIYLGICISVLATLGDLFESMLKRSLSIKDFGNIIPGHGGILDRIDSLLFVVPGAVLASYIAIYILL